jgi:hypothetical protein
MIESTREGESAIECCASKLRRISRYDAKWHEEEIGSLKVAPRSSYEYRYLILALCSLQGDEIIVGMLDE